MILPELLRDFFAPFAFAFTEPTHRRFVLLALGAVLCTGRRTVANILRTLGPLAPGDPSAYRRILCRAPWPALALGCALARMTLARWQPEGPVILVGDETVDRHKGKKVHGKARHRDPCRSSRTYTAFAYGHKWVVLAVLVRLPGATRPWALPVFIDLYRSAEQNRLRRRPHRTPAELMARLLRLWLMRMPGRAVFVGDGAYGTHPLARFCRRHRRRLSLVSKLHPAANLHRPPPSYSGKGRPRVKGAKLPSPEQAVAGAKLRRCRVGWYGGGTRVVRTAGGTGHWHKSGKGLAHLRWVFVRDVTGTHRDEYFFSTDPGMSVRRIIGLYTGRWNIETTFEESRAHLGLGTTRGYGEKTVLRAAPCLLGLYTAVALLYDGLPERSKGVTIRWEGKAGVTFSDALSRVRRWLWDEGVLTHPDAKGGVSKLPEPIREVLLTTLAPAA